VEEKDLKKVDEKGNRKKESSPLPARSMKMRKNLWGALLLLAWELVPWRTPFSHTWRE